MHARGIKERTILFKNVLHNALGSIITIVSLQIRSDRRQRRHGNDLSLAGYWQHDDDSITARDYPVVQGAVLILSTLRVLVNL